MTERLARIGYLILSLTTIGVVVSAATGIGTPLGVALGGGAALLDFAVLCRLGAAALRTHPNPAHLVPLALVKTVLLVAIPAAAMLLPASAVDAPSFGAGVTALPLAVVLDALVLPAPATRARADG